MKDLPLRLFTLLALVFLFSCDGDRGRYELNGPLLSVHLDSGYLFLKARSADIIEVIRSKEKPATFAGSKIADPDIAYENVDLKEEGGGFITLAAGSVKVRVNVHNGQLTFYGEDGKGFLEALPVDQSVLVENSAPDTGTYRISQHFTIPGDEGLYGLGQFQDGVMNYRDHSLTLVQQNTVAVNPFLVTSGGTGILWDNYSRTEFSDSLGITSFTSEVGNYIDYYVVAGKTMDGAIRGYRQLTGDAPMYGKWAFGYWQSKNAYRTQKEIVGVVEKFRDMKIPLDNIVQDFSYWREEIRKTDDWNSTVFYPGNYANPVTMIEQIHQMNAHIMISIWPSFGDQTEIYKEMEKRGFLLNLITYPKEHVKLYDAFNPAARDLYWNFVNRNLYSKGIDAWWMDATEPEIYNPRKEIDTVQTYFGSLKEYFNLYSYFSCKGIYEHQLQTNPDRRVFILTRSSFAGQQKFASATWSGDVHSNWGVFSEQIPAGLNFCMAGIPYWTTDIGGYFARNDYPLGIQDPGFVELYVRWYQYGAFCPLFRSHGTTTPRENYLMGKPGSWSYDALLKYDRLRYRLLPYIYSLSRKVTTEGYTMMRGLAMDFPRDERVRSLGSEYMFGPAFLVAPVTREMYTIKGEQPEVMAKENFGHTGSADVYLPVSNGWYDFWTGEYLPGGQSVKKATPIDIMPLYVKAGAVIPFGPHEQYATEKDEDPLEIRVYPGDDGMFILYEDENDGFGFKNGKFTEISFRWDEAAQALTIGNRKGSYPGMHVQRTFHVVWVGKDHGTGGEICRVPDKTITYDGSEIVISR